MNSKDFSIIVQEITTSIIATVIILGYFLLVGYQLVNGRDIQSPAGVELLVGAVAGTYFGKVLAVNGARQAGTAAAQAMAANSTPLPTSPAAPPPLAP